MRRMLPWLPLLAAACTPSLEGWWEVDEIALARAGDEVSRRDAGFALFDEYGSLDLGLSYVLDPVGLTLVPNPDPIVLGLPTEVERTPEGEADLSFYLDGSYFEIDLVDQRSATVTLQSLPTPDGTTLRLDLVR